MDLGAEDVAAKHPTYPNIISIMIPLVIRFKRHRHRIGALQYVSFYNGLLFFTDLFVESICWICRLALAILLQTWGFAAKRKCANKTDWWVTKNVHLPRSLFVRDGHANTECWTARIYVQLHGNLAINEGNVGGKHISRKGQTQMVHMELTTINPRGKGTSWAQTYPLNSRDYLFWFAQKMLGNMYEHWNLPLCHPWKITNHLQQIQTKDGIGAKHVIKFYQFLIVLIVSWRVPIKAYNDSPIDPSNKR